MTAKEKKEHKSTNIKSKKTKSVNKSKAKKDNIKQQLLDAQQSAKNSWDKIIRLQAEIENIKRRNLKDLENAHKFAMENFVKELLSVADSMQMGIDSVNSKDVKLDTIVEGIKTTQKALTSIFNKFGVEMLNPKGEKFNPDYHQAITMLDDDKKESNTIKDVIQVGYTLNGRLIRPAMVVVIK